MPEDIPVGDLQKNFSQSLGLDIPSQDSSNINSDSIEIHVGEY